MAGEPKVPFITNIVALLQVVVTVPSSNCNAIVVSITGPSELAGETSIVVIVGIVINMPNQQSSAPQQGIPPFSYSVLNENVFVFRKLFVDDEDTRI